jgi:hypothetical protein
MLDNSCAVLRSMLGSKLWYNVELGLEGKEGKSLGQCEIIFHSRNRTPDDDPRPEPNFTTPFLTYWGASRSEALGMTLSEC